jgi:hypothetical protein
VEEAAGLLIVWGRAEVLLDYGIWRGEKCVYGVDLGYLGWDLLCSCIAWFIAG